MCVHTHLSSPGKWKKGGGDRRYILFLSSSWVGEAGTRVIWAAGFEGLPHVLRMDAERRGASDRVALTLVLLKAIGALDGEIEFRALQKKLRKNLHCVEGRW